MFSIQILFDYPDLFQAHIAISPYIMWDNNHTLNHVVEKMQKPLIFKNYLYITLGNEPNYVEPLGILTKTLESENPEGLEWHFTVSDNDNHGTIPLKSLYNGLETLYKNWIIPAAVAEKGITAVENHYKNLSERFGYIIDIPENVLNAMGYREIAKKKFDTAIEFFLHNVKLYPNSANVYDSLGEGYEAAGQLDLARKNYKIAIKKGTELNDPNLGIYKDHLENISQKIKNQES